MEWCMRAKSFPSTKGNKGTHKTHQIRQSKVTHFQPRNLVELMRKGQKPHPPILTHINYSLSVYFYFL